MSKRRQLLTPALHQSFVVVGSRRISTDDLIDETADFGADPPDLVSTRRPPVERCRRALGRLPDAVGRRRRRLEPVADLAALAGTAAPVDQRHRVGSQSLEVCRSRSTLVDRFLYQDFTIRNDLRRLR